MHAKESPPCCGFLSLRLEDQKQRAIAKKDSAPHASSPGLGTTGSEYMAYAACTAVSGKYRYCFTRGYGRTGVVLVPKELSAAFLGEGSVVMQGAHCTKRVAFLRWHSGSARKYPRVGIRKICTEKDGWILEQLDRSGTPFCGNFLLTIQVITFKYCQDADGLVPVGLRLNIHDLGGVARLLILLQIKVLITSVDV